MGEKVVYSQSRVPYSLIINRIAPMKKFQLIFLYEFYFCIMDWIVVGTLKSCAFVLALVCPCEISQNFSRLFE